MSRVTPPNGLSVVEYQADDPGFELLSELAARPPLRCVGHRSGIGSPTGKMFTDSDQAHDDTPKRRAERPLEPQFAIVRRIQRLTGTDGSHAARRCAPESSAQQRVRGPDAVKCCHMHPGGRWQ